jgi:hypothetical protein
MFRFLRPERVSFASVEILSARLTDSAPVSTIDYRLHVRDTRGVVTTQTFTTAFNRSLVLLALVKQPVDLRIEDVAVTL